VRAPARAARGRARRRPRRQPVRPPTAPNAPPALLFPPASFANRGFAVDGGTAFVNVALLLLLVALAGERIFGLDKVRPQERSLPPPRLPIRRAPAASQGSARAGLPAGGRPGARTPCSWGGGAGRARGRGRGPPGGPPHLLFPPPPPPRTQHPPPALETSGPLAPRPQVINEALRRWKESRVEARRYEVMDARQQLERQWSDDEDGGGSGGSGSGSGSGRGGDGGASGRG
jgi:hypothetical protein